MTAPRRRFPRAVTLLFWNGLIGAAIGCVAAAAMLIADTGGIRTLAAQSGSLWLASALLAGSFALTFASLAMGSAIMLLPHTHPRD
ncbi:MAG: hypothetical protein JSS20_18830 [Proteobacteria bacterium]|nr:hypothetical protein [Pseudomonadota bacterium]